MELSGVRLTPFPTMHDTPGSCGLRLDAAEGSLGFCTDLGVVTDEVKSALAGVDAALIEANHDVDMLRFGPYPAVLSGAYCPSTATSPTRTVRPWPCSWPETARIP